MMRANNRHRRVRRGRGFTLVELMITIMIIGIMAGMLVFALFGAQEAARAAKTKSLVVKLDAIIKAKWDAYKTRRMPVTVPPFPATATVPIQQAWKQNVAILRLYALHDLMRMEMPDRWSDVSDGPAAPQTFDPTVATAPIFGGSPPNILVIPQPSSSLSYLRKYNAIMSGSNPPSLATAQNYQGAECLYAIVMAAIQEDGDSREVFKPDDVADTDGDGFPEFVDGWKQPIRFLRWAPGFQLSELQIVANNLQANSTTITGTSLSSASGSYVGGALFPLTGTNNQFNAGNAAKLTSYSWSSGVATITTSGGGSPTGLSVICAPDPFDVAGAYSASASGSPSFALYPFIYSSGPDKCYGITSDFATTLRYALPAIGLNPFTIPSGGGAMIGTAADLTTEPIFVPSGWLDNIHNHQLGLKK